MTTTRFAALAALAAALAFGAACTNSGLGGTDTLPATGAPTTGTGTETTGGDCAWEGTWVLSEIPMCGQFPIGDWESVYTDVSMTISPAADGGCEVLAEWAGPECGEAEVFEVDPVEEPDTIDFNSDGVSECESDGCMFDSTDPDGCEVGDRAGIHSVIVDPSTPDVLELTGFSSHAWAPCTLEFVTVWEKQ